MSNLKKIDRKKLTKEERGALILYSIQFGIIVATVTCIISIIGTCYFFVLHMRSPQKLLEEQAVLSDEDIHKFLIDNNIVLDDKSEDIIQYIKNYSIYDVKSEDLKDGVYKGIVNSLGDMYSEYITYDENMRNNETDSGNFVGIGIRYSKKLYDSSVRIISVVPGGPADIAGLRPNDAIKELDGKPVEFLSMTEMSNMVRGEKGTSVEIKVIRGDDTLVFNPIRDNVTSKLVDYQEITQETGANDRVAYVHLREFSGKAGEQFNEACDFMEKEGIQNMILDLRGNVGGNVDILEDIASNLIKKGKIAEIKGKTSITTRDVVSKGSKHNFKIVCLVDKNSASASEMLSGSLRDINDTILIGEKTFGKGIAQTTVDLSDGSALKLTTAEYYLYNGENIHKVGIEPDIVIEHNYIDDVTNITSDEVVLKAVEVLNNNIYTATALHEFENSSND